MTFDYSLQSMLPFARAAIRDTSNFALEGFFDNLFAELEKAHVKGVQKRATPTYVRYDYSDLICPVQLKYGSIEVFYFLLHKGLILPEPQSFPQGFNLARYWKTPKGDAWAKGFEPIPEDALGYVKHLNTLAPHLDPIVNEYVREGLGSFEREMYFSAAVMLGAASEKEIYLLGESLSKSLASTVESAQLTKMVTTGRSLYTLLETIRRHLEKCKKFRDVFDGADTHLMSLFESIRVQRNEAVHPAAAHVSEESVRGAYNAFPKAIQKAEQLREWFASHLGAI